MLVAPPPCGAPGSGRRRPEGPREPGLEGRPHPRRACPRRSEPARSGRRRPACRSTSCRPCCSCCRGAGPGSGAGSGLPKLGGESGSSGSVGSSFAPPPRGGFGGASCLGSSTGAARSSTGAAGLHRRGGIFDPRSGALHRRGGVLHRRGRALRNLLGRSLDRRFGRGRRLRGDGRRRGGLRRHRRRCSRRRGKRCLSGRRRGCSAGAPFSASGAASDPSASPPSSTSAIRQKVAMLASARAARTRASSRRGWKGTTCFISACLGWNLSRIGVHPPKSVQLLGRRGQSRRARGGVSLQSARNQVADAVGRPAAPLLHERDHGSSMHPISRHVADFFANAALERH